MCACLAFGVTQAQTDATISQLRPDYGKLEDDDDLTEEWWEKLDAHELSATALYRGYKGAIMTILASHSFSPYRKMKRFAVGSYELDKAIMAAPELLELRYLRYTVQCNAPGFLDYDRNLAEDEQMLIEGLSNGLKEKDRVLATMIYDFLSSVERCDATKLAGLAP